MNDVVPISMEVVSHDLQGGQLFEGHALPDGVVATIDRGADDETGTSCRVPDEAHHRLERAQRPSAPVHRDEGEKTMFDLVPFARARRKVADVDRTSDFVGEPL